MLVVNLGCSPHVEQRGEVGFCRSCLSMRHRMPRRPRWQVKRKDVTVIGGLSKIDHARLRKGHAPYSAKKSLHGRTGVSNAEKLGTTLPI